MISLRLKLIHDFFYRKRFPVSAIGVSNITELPENGGKLLALEFYEIDCALTNEIENRILEIFTNDIIILSSKHGFHFVSFVISEYTPSRWRARVNALSKELEQDYHSKAIYCCLRTSPKVLNNVVISEKPQFLKILRFPKANSIISKYHLKQYFEYNGLPEKLYNYYLKYCEIVKHRIVYHYYRTR